jgi:hypothetical protein
MSEATIRATVKSTLESVSGIGVVHDYMRDSRSATKFINLLTSGGIVNGWMFSRTATHSEWLEDSTLRGHTFTIKGYYELNDLNASEKNFQGIITAIQNKFESVPTLSEVYPAPPLQVESVPPEGIEIGDKLYHFCVLNLTVHEIED